MKYQGLTILVMLVAVLCSANCALAIAEDEEAWINLERNRPNDALTKCQDGEGFLCRWLVAEVEVLTDAAPSADDPVSKASRAFANGEFDEAAGILEPLLLQNYSESDLLQLRLHLGAVLVELGRIAEAEELLTLAIDQARNENRRASLCYGLLTRGRARVRLRQVEPPRQDLQDALDLCRRLETHRWAGVAAIALSVVSRLQMDLEDALYWRESAFEFYRHAGDLKGQARALHYIAAIGIINGELTTAMTQLQDARDLARQAESDDELGGILGEMAAINYLLGDFDKALIQYREAVRLAPNPWRRGMMLVNIGSIHEYRRQFDEALPALEEALELMRQVGDHRTETQALQSLGEALCELDRCEEGLAYLDEAIATARQYDIPLSEASALEIKGHGLLRQGLVQEAASSFEEATRLAREIGYFDILEWSLLGQAKVARQNGDTKQALEFLEAAMEEVAQVRRRSGGSASVSGGIVNQAGGIYEEMIDLLYEMHQKDSTAGYDKQAYAAAQEARARSFLDLMVEAEYDLQISAVPGYRRQESELLDQLVAVEEKLVSADADSLGYWEARLATAEDELHLLEARLKKEDPRYAEVLYRTPLSADAVGGSVLQTGEVLLEYFLGEKASYLWVLRKNDVHWVPLPGRKEIEEQVRQILPLLNDYNLTGPEAAWFVEPSRLLYRMLVAPVAREIAGAKRLIICADGILHYLPFEVLLTEDTTATEYGKLPWLVKNQIVTYTPSSSVLGQIRNTERTVQPSRRWLLVGNPVQLTGENAGLFARAAGATGLPALDFAREELLSLAALAPSTVLSGKEATLHNLLDAEKNQDFSLIHFACHGLYNEQRARYSGLVISADPANDDDGFLSISEVLSLGLKCDQVVLSACASALGPHATGDALVGLTRSFMFGGARSVVSALWDVSGRETSSFMTKYYSRLAGDDTGRAQKLAGAKRSMIDAGTRHGVDLAHPTFWAGFVLSGDGR